MMNIQRRLLLAVSLFAGLLLGPVSAEGESTVGTNATRGLLRGITDQRSLQGLGTGSSARRALSAAMGAAARSTRMMAS